jgi:hypothetical protein
MKSPVVAQILIGRFGDTPAGRFAPDSLLEGGVRCELVSKVSFIRRSDEFLESIKKGIETSNPSLKPKFPC